MRFSRIRLENWRNFSEVDVPLQTRVFIVGANASGKSNLLDAFRFLRHLVVPGGGLQDAISTRGGVPYLRNLAARFPNTNIVIEVDLEDGGEILWRYRLAFNKTRQDRLPVLHEEKVWQGDTVILERPNEDDRSDPALLAQTHLEQTIANRGFRDIADFFASVHYSHIIPQIVRDPDRAVGKASGDPFGGDFLEQVASANKSTQEARLRYIQDALKVAIPQLSSLELYRDSKGRPHLRGKYEHWRSQGAWQSETEFSDGTLRLMGLLWALQEGDGPLLMEEPEQSLHPGVVRFLPQMILNIQRRRKVALRQIIISTHSPELLSDEGIAADEVLLLHPGSEGTRVALGVELLEVKRELDAGLTIADAVLPRTEPPALQHQPSTHG